MLRIMVFLVLLSASQWIADQVKQALPAGAISSWLWTLLVHYILLLLLLVFFDGAAFRDAISPSLFLLWLVRTFYFFRRLKST